MQTPWKASRGADGSEPEWDSMMVFSASANRQMWIMNDEVYGFMMPMLDEETTYAVTYRLSRGRQSELCVFQDERLRFKTMKFRHMDVKNPEAQFLMNMILPAENNDLRKCQEEKEESQPAHKDCTSAAVSKVVANLQTAPPHFCCMYGSRPTARRK
jgi:hypothetical protein